MAAGTFDQARFRKVLGALPTGVCALTAVEPSGGLLGMIIGSFTSVSLDPALVGFFADRRSTTWPRIAAVRRFCVNVLSVSQEAACRQLARSGEDKFQGLAHHPSPFGAPIIDGAVAWFDCELHAQAEAGDHFGVLAQVTALDVASQELPMIFCRGGFGGFSAVTQARPFV